MPNDPAIAALWQHFDIEYLADFADRLVAIGQYDLGFRLPGTESGRQAAQLIADEMETIGLQQVRQEPFTVHGWDFKGASLTLHTSSSQEFTASSFAASPGTPTEGLTADLIDVGCGTTADFESIDLRGKAALARVDMSKMPWLDSIAYEAELRGAVGVVLYFVNQVAQHESGLALTCQDGNLRQTIPVINLCRKDGELVAAQLAQNPLNATIHCQATNTLQATGYNVVGVLPGSRYPDRYLVLQAHYDSWFYGYWDNAIGVAGILAMAKALIESGYQPQHTILIVSPDAEEFGTPNSAAGWLYGCQKLLEAHPEWAGQMTCALNIDTLAHHWQQAIEFSGPAEIVQFIRDATAGYSAENFPQTTVQVKEWITPWTEVYNYTYFGIPTIEPRFNPDDNYVPKTVYHTQFDDASLVNLPGAAEILKLYGGMLIHLDQLPIAPYNFVERVQSLKKTVDFDLAQRTGVNLAEVTQAIATFEQWAVETNVQIQHLNHADPPPTTSERLALNDKVRNVARQLIPSFYFTEADNPDSGQYEHLLWQRELLALAQALTHLERGDAQGAIAALTHPETGVQGGWYALNMSYQVYYRNTQTVRNPARTDLLWAKGRTIPLNDIWVDLHNLSDKQQRDLTNFEPEIYNLRQKRDTMAAGYRAALERLGQTLREAIK